MHSCDTWEQTLTSWMQSQNSAYEYFYVTREPTTGTARHWTFIIERRIYDGSAQTWGPRRQCLVVSIKPQTQKMSWDDFAERAAQDASNIARKTDEVVFFVGDLTVFHGYQVQIEGPDELSVAELSEWQNRAHGLGMASDFKTLAIYNDNNMKACGD